MGQSSLGRVLDPSALSACAGPRGRLRVEVPAEWLAEGATLRVTAPPRLSCARCDGGGCDACGRSGALRVPGEASERVVLASLPVGQGDAVVLRIPQPFGVEQGVDQLLLEVHAAEAPSACVARVVTTPVRGLARIPAVAPWALVAVTVAAAILAAIFGR